MTDDPKVELENRKEEERLLEEKRQNLKDAYAKVSHSDEMTLIIDDILDFCGLKEPSLNINHLNLVNINQLMSYREGQRSIAFFINDRMEGQD